MNKKLTHFMLALAFSVFLFALYARVSLYQPDGPGHSGGNSKLLLNGQKMDLLSSSDSNDNAGSFLLSVLPAILFLLSPLFRRFSAIGWAYVAPVHFPYDSFQRSRFLRPPPIL
jgi:hypothetical protein